MSLLPFSSYRTFPADPYLVSTTADLTAAAPTARYESPGLRTITLTVRTSFGQPAIFTMLLYVVGMTKARVPAGTTAPVSLPRLVGESVETEPLAPNTTFRWFRSRMIGTGSTTYPTDATYRLLGSGLSPPPFATPDETGSWAYRLEITTAGRAVFNQTMSVTVSGLPSTHFTYTDSNPQLPTMSTATCAVIAAVAANCFSYQCEFGQRDLQVARNQACFYPPAFRLLFLTATESLSESLRIH
jgi:hypothetical protein